MNQKAKTVVLLYLLLLNAFKPLKFEKRSNLVRIR